MAARTKKNEAKKWIALLALLISIGTAVYLFLAYGPEFMVRTLSGSIGFLPLAMTKQSDDEPKINWVSFLTFCFGGFFLFIVIFGLVAILSR